MNHSYFSISWNRCIIFAETEMNRNVRISMPAKPGTTDFLSILCIFRVLSITTSYHFAKPRYSSMPNEWTIHDLFSRPSHMFFFRFSDSILTNVSALGYQTHAFKRLHKRSCLFIYLQRPEQCKVVVSMSLDNVFAVTGLNEVFH